MKKIKNPYVIFYGWIFLTLAGAIIFSGIKTSYGFTLGQTYDSSNWQEIENIAPPFLLNWVKRGDFILKTGSLNFDVKLEKDFLQTSQKNIRKFDVNDKGFIVEVESQEPPKFIYGLPFPNVSSQYQKAGEKIMANFHYGRMRMGGYIKPNRFIWVGKDSLEREISTVIRILQYQGRPGGQIQNADNFLYQACINVASPMDLAGTVQLIWEYNDERQATYFTYASMIRRISRATPNTRSNPFLGTDMSSDDNDLWLGKNESFNWKLLGEKEILCCFSSPEKIMIKEMPDKTVRRVSPQLQMGSETPNWQGALWAPVNVVWSPRPVWIVEGVPKDSEYNAGKVLFYLDRDAFTIWFKEYYDQSGEYWKTFFALQSYQVAPSGRNNLFYPDAFTAIDDQNQHATHHIIIDSASGVNNVIYCPKSVLGPKDFSLSSAQELSK